MYRRLYFIGLYLTLALKSQALSISLDFSGNSFFDTGTTNGQLARNAVSAAADDLSAAITTELIAFNTYEHTGTAGSPNVSSVTITGSLGYTNPDNGNSETFSGSLASNEFRIFVGAQSLGGSILGQGGPGSAGFESSASFFNEPDLQSAATNAANLFTNEFTRGGSVITSSLSTTLGSASFSVSFGPTIGNLWFDNDGSSDFHFDHTTSVGAGKVDLYSVALHEMLHAVGIGTYDSWDSQVSGTSWTGAEVIAENGGTGAGLIDSDGAHIAENVMSARLSDGVLQEVVMDPNILVGTRKELTQLDLAFLRDLGFQTIPEPTSTALIALGSLALIFRRQK